ncbi:hypothetical protein MCEMAEM21_02690 [Oxalobacteraceae bacterium]
MDPGLRRGDDGEIAQYSKRRAVLKCCLVLTRHASRVMQHSERHTGVGRYPQCLVPVSLTLAS